MKTNLLTGGLSARRKTIDLMLRRIADVSSRVILVLITAIIALTSCHNGTDRPDGGKVTRKDPDTARADTLHNLKTDVTVNRRYDSKGNLTGFDSSYTASFSNIPGDTIQMDSLKKRFSRFFSTRRSNWFDNRVNSLFFNDPFFQNDPFMMRYKRKDLFSKDRMLRMDSVNHRPYAEQNQNDHQANKRI